VVSVVLGLVAGMLLCGFEGILDGLRLCVLVDRSITKEQLKKVHSIDKHMTLKVHCVILAASGGEVGIATNRSYGGRQENMSSSTESSQLSN